MHLSHILLFDKIDLYALYMYVYELGRKTLISDTRAYSSIQLIVSNMTKLEPNPVNFVRMYRYFDSFLHPLMSNDNKEF